MTFAALLLMVLVLALIVGVAYVGFMLVDAAGVPSPINWILKVVVLIAALYAIVQYVLPGAHLG